MRRISLWRSLAYVSAMLCLALILGLSGTAAQGVGSTYTFGEEDDDDDNGGGSGDGTSQLSSTGTGVPNSTTTPSFVVITMLMAAGVFAVRAGLGVFQRNRA